MKWLTKRHIALYLTILMLAFLVAAFAITKGTPLHKEDTHYLYSGWLTAESRDPENEPYFEKGQTVYQLRMVHELDDTVKGKVLSFRTYDSYVDAWFCDSPDIPADNDSAFYHFGETLRFCDSPGTYTHFLSIPERMHSILSYGWRLHMPTSSSRPMTWQSARKTNCCTTI